MSRRRKIRPVVEVSKLPKPQPSFRDRKPLDLFEVPAPAETVRRLIQPGFNTYLRNYMLGECSVIVTRELGKWHLSIAHPLRYPTWDEVAEARYRLLPKSAMFVMPLPPEKDYINEHPNCFQVFQIDPAVLGDTEPVETEHAS